jgi:mannose-1-phosphate guanylyltransferase
MRTKALLLAGGKGTRLRPLTDHTPKCLVEIGGRVILDYWCDSLVRAGVLEALLNTHHLRGAVVKYIHRINADHSIQLTEAYEPELLGSAGTIHANRSWMDDADTCVIIYADNLSNVDLKSLIAFHESHNDPFTMMLFYTTKPQQCGIAELDADGRVISFVEKPDHPKGNLANAGIYVVSADAWREMADMNAFDLGFDVLPKFAGRMRGWLHEGYHRDIGNHDALEAAQRDVHTWFETNTRSSEVGDGARARTI